MWDYYQLIIKAEVQMAQSIRLRAKADKLFQKAQEVRDKTSDPGSYRWRFNKANHYYDVANERRRIAEKLLAEAEMIKPTLQAQNGSATIGSAR